MLWGAGFAVLAALAAVYALADPGQSAFFPKCPFKMLTGLDCPGCGSQRAIHALLNLDLPGALGANPLFVAAIPYLALGFALDAVKDPSEQALAWRKRLYGRRAIFVVLGVIIVFWAARNVKYFI